MKGTSTSNESIVDAHQPETWREAVESALFGPGKVSAMVCVALPTVAFVAAVTLRTLTAAIVAASVTALIVFGYRLLVKQPVRPALTGLAIAAVCAAAAALTGDTRGFFLAPTAITVLIVVICLVTIAVRRPLAGLLLNRLAGGPPGWHQHRELVRVYTSCTLVCVAVNVVSTALQIFGYIIDNTVLLAALHIINPIVFTVIIAITIAVARKAVSRQTP
ncbi:MAG: DUF3159 domain-containing protein [Mycobacterium sp.]